MGDALGEHEGCADHRETWLGDCRPRNAGTRSARLSAAMAELRVTVMCGWLDADPEALADDLATASPELVAVISSSLDDDETDMAAHLRHAANDGAAHAVVVAPAATNPHHLRHIIDDALATLCVTGQRVVLNALVAIVDITEFRDALATETDVVEELGDLAPDGDDRTIAEVIVDQVEAADLVVLRGTEMVTPESVEQFRTLLFALNPNAPIETCLVCALDPIGLLRHTHQMAVAGWREPAWLEVIDGRRSFAPMRHGVEVLTWRSRRPLDPLAFHRLIDDGIAGLVRARGFFWLASRPDLVGSLGIAGASTVIETCGSWWAATSHDEWPADPVEQDVIASAWDAVVGDRSNDLVFIGIDLDETALRNDLERCEVHDIEGVLSGRRVFVDPFDAWPEPVTNAIPVIDDWGPPYPVKCN